MIALSACSEPASLTVVQAPDRLASAFGDVIKGCAAQVSDAGVVDQKALAATGWKATSRMIQKGAQQVTLPTDGYATLARGEYEATQWRHPAHTGVMELIRWDTRSADRSLDQCVMQGQVEGKAALAAVVGGLARQMGRPADRTGSVPRGGDFLTPRSDPARSGYYWAMPRNDVYLETAPDGFATIDVVAMPDREALDRFSPDRPENRIVILPGDRP